MRDQTRYLTKAGLRKLNDLFGSLKKHREVRVIYKIIGGPPKARPPKSSP